MGRKNSILMFLVGETPKIKLLKWLDSVLKLAYMEKVKIFKVFIAINCVENRIYG